MNGLELIDADNPFLKPLGDYVNLLDWPHTLVVDPLAGIDCRNLSGMQQDLLLAQIRHRFEPTTYTIDIVSRLQTMIWRRYVYANPLIPRNRRRTMNVLGQRGSTLSNDVWLPMFADAFMVMGCTGSGKSTTVDRYLKCLAPYWEHSREQGADWNSHLQITYLVVPMPVHKGGLLYAILAAIDGTIGSSYRAKYGDRRIWTVEKLAVEVGILLVQHSVGLLVIEEIQARNFSASPNREEMLLFILRLLNFGIPIVLVGNPLGFAGLEDFTQDINRLTASEPVHMVPFSADDPDWMDGIGPGMWSHNIMPRPTSWNEKIAAELFECSAAIPEYVRKATEVSQRMAMNEPGCDALSVNHLRRYRDESLTFQRNRDLIDGFRLKDPFKLMRYIDVPWEEYGLKWGKISLDDIVSAGGGDDTIASGMKEEDKAAYRSVHGRIRQAAAAQLTRHTNKTKASRSAKAAASSDDLRSGSSALLATGLDVLRQNVKKQKNVIPEPPSTAQ